MSDQDDPLTGPVKVAGGAIFAAFTMLLAVLAFIEKPYVRLEILWGGCALALSCIIILGYVTIRRRRDRTVPHARKLGFVNFGVAAVFVLFLWFLYANYKSDADAPPRIEKLTLTESQVGPGAIIDAEVFATDDAKDALSYAWKLDDAPIANESLQLAHIAAPLTPGAHKISVTVTDGQHSITAQAPFIVTPTPPPAPAAEKSGPIPAGH